MFLSVRSPGSLGTGEHFLVWEVPKDTLSRLKFQKLFYYLRFESDLVNISTSSKETYVAWFAG